jgi:hypothetical protein
MADKKHDDRLTEIAGGQHADEAPQVFKVGQMGSAQNGRRKRRRFKHHLSFAEMMSDKRSYIKYIHLRTQSIPYTQLRYPACAGMLLAVLLLCCNCAKGQRMSSLADRYLEAFQRGEEFHGPSTGLIVGGTPHAASGQIMRGQPDRAVLAQLSQALTSDSPFVRQNVVALLVDIGLQVDPRRPEGTEALCDREIIETLVKGGLARRDAAREATMDALRKLVRPADLSAWADAFAKAVDEKPTKDALLMVAKAKAIGAKPLVAKLSQSPQWTNDESLRIAQAALGNKVIEDEFVAETAKSHASKDSKQFVESLAPLAMIGTRTSLVALAKYLRTPLTFLIPEALERSLRLNVLDALRYHYPDQPEFYPNNIHAEADYTAAEHFCTKELSVTYEMPVPPFMTYRPFPIPLK